MAYETVRASSQSFTVSSAPVTSVPITISALFYSSDSLTNQNLINLLTNSGDVLGVALAFRGDASSVIRASSFPTPYVFADQSGYTLNSWARAAGIFTGAITLKSYLDTLSTSQSGSQAAGTPNRLEIAGFRGGNTLSGRIAEAAVWNVELTDAEVASLSKGFKPTRIRPQSLVFYAPLIRNLQDTKGALAITNNNSATVIQHPRVI